VNVSDITRSRFFVVLAEVSEIHAEASAERFVKAILSSSSCCCLFVSSRTFSLA